MRKVNIVIFSSGISEKNGILDEVIKGLEAKGHAVFCWRDLFKDAHESTNIALLPMLIKKIPSFDFAVLIGESHDFTTLYRKGKRVEVPSMRDNVIFEIGLSVMALGLKRVILLTDKSVRLPEDLTGLHGDLAIKHIIWSRPTYVVKKINNHIQKDNREIVPNIFNEMTTYIEKYKCQISPVVIGASTSAAIGYITNFILRLLEKINTGFMCNDRFMPVDTSSIFLHIVIPENYEEGTFITADNNNPDLQVGILKNARSRPLSFKFKMEKDSIHIYDYPTTLVTSYDTARMILDIKADDEEDPLARTRFYQKELDLFGVTLRIILNKNFISEKVNSYYPSLPNEEKEKMIQQILYIVEHNFYIERV